MHELGVVFHVIKHVDKIAEQNKAKLVNSVTLEIGKVSGIIPSYLDDCFKWAVNNRSSHMQGCKLKIEEIDAITYCENCKSKYDTIKYGKICPNCKSDKTYLIQGNEFVIKEIEVS